MSLFVRIGDLAAVAGVGGDAVGAIAMPPILAGFIALSILIVDGDFALGIQSHRTGGDVNMGEGAATRTVGIESVTTAAAIAEVPLVVR